MWSTGFDAFHRATQTAYSWLGEVARRLGTDDRNLAYRALRAWLHTLRDRLGVESAAHFAAQLPELLRGVYYDGWQPAKVPVKYDAEAYRERFAREAAIPLAEVDAVCGAVSAALRERMAPGQLEQALAQLPQQVRAVVEGPPELALTWTARPEPAAGQASGYPAVRAGDEPTAASTDERLHRMETQMDRLTAAVRTLAVGLEQPPYEPPGSNRGAQAARRAHELLLTAPMSSADDGG